MTIDGQPEALLVRGLTAGARGRLMNACMITDGEGESRVDNAKLSTLLLMECVCTPDGAPLFQPTDMEVLEQCAAAWLDPLIVVVGRLSGISAQAQQAAEGNSLGITASDSATSSPVNLVA